LPLLQSRRALRTEDAVPWLASWAAAMTSLSHPERAMTTPKALTHEYNLGEMLSR
jgi:hypothetical protein